MIKIRKGQARAQLSRIQFHDRFTQSFEDPLFARVAQESPMPTENAESQAEVARLVTELESAEAYELKLRQIIVEVRDQLAAGNTANALSMLNQALSYIDDATDVVTSRAEP